MKKSTAFVFRLSRKTKVVGTLMIFIEAFQALFFILNSSTTQSIQTLDKILQKRIDSIQAASFKPKVYPFNLNFLTDTNAYFMEIRPSQFDRLIKYRKQGKWINSVSQIKEVTKVDQVWIEQYRPYFKFPSRSQKKNKKKIPLRLLELNTATSNDLTKVRGIGSVLSDRIIDYRSHLNGFSTLDQLDEVYGLSPQVVNEIKYYFTLSKPAKIDKIEIDKASVYELAKIPYLTWKQARSIVALRTKQGAISLGDLHQIETIDSLQIKRLTLYLF